MPQDHGLILGPRDSKQTLCEDNNNNNNNNNSDINNNNTEKVSVNQIKTPPPGTSGPRIGPPVLRECRKQSIAYYNKYR